MDPGITSLYVDPGTELSTQLVETDIDPVHKTFKYMNLLFDLLFTGGSTADDFSALDEQLFKRHHINPQPDFSNLMDRFKEETTEFKLWLKWGNVMVKKPINHKGATFDLPIYVAIPRGNTNTAVGNFLTSSMGTPKISRKDERNKTSFGTATALGEPGKNDEKLDGYFLIRSVADFEAYISSQWFKRFPKADTKKSQKSLAQREDKQKVVIEHLKSAPTNFRVFFAMVDDSPYTIRPKRKDESDIPVTIQLSVDQAIDYTYYKDIWRGWEFFGYYEDEFFYTHEKKNQLTPITDNLLMNFLRQTYHESGMTFDIMDEAYSATSAERTRKTPMPSNIPKALPVTNSSSSSSSDSSGGGSTSSSSFPLPCVPAPTPFAPSTPVPSTPYEAPKVDMEYGDQVLADFLDMQDTNSAFEPDMNDLQGYVPLRFDDDDTPASPQRVTTTVPFTPSGDTPGGLHVVRSESNPITPRPRDTDQGDEGDEDQEDDGSSSDSENDEHLTSDFQ